METSLKVKTLDDIVLKKLGKVLRDKGFKKVEEDPTPENYSVTYAANKGYGRIRIYLIKANISKAKVSIAYSNEEIHKITSNDLRSLLESYGYIIVDTYMIPEKGNKIREIIEVYWKQNEQ